MTEHTTPETESEAGIETGKPMLRRIAAGGLAATLAVVGLGAALGVAGAETRTATAAATAEIGSAVIADTPERQHDSDDIQADDGYGEYEQGYDDGWEDGYEAGLSDADDDWPNDEQFGDEHGDFEDGDFEEEAGHDDHDHDGYEDEEPLATFPVDGDRLDTDGIDAATVSKGEAIWDRFTDLIPADQRTMVVGFELLPEAYEGAHVYPDENDPAKWVLGVGLGLGEDLDYVLIHEFGHLLTLQAEEVPPSDDTGTCPTYHTGEGCALKGSTFAEFVARFWPQDLRDQLEQDGPEAVYEDDPDRFVTDYAATNPAEDLAEVFAVFVTGEKPTGGTEGPNSIAMDKVRFLWDDADMVELRNQIRAAL